MKCAKYAQYLSIGVCLMVAAMAASAQRASETVLPGEKVSGMYSFLREGEFVQITVQPSQSTPTPVTGFISSFGEGDSDKGAFLDRFFTKGALSGNALSFSTKAVHGISYDFSGTISRGPAMSHTQEGYYVIKGILTRNTLSEGKPGPASSREITMKMFPDLNTETVK